MKQEIIYKNVNSLKGKTYLYNDGRTIVMHCKHCNKNVKPDALLKINKYNKMLFFFEPKKPEKTMLRYYTNERFKRCGRYELVECICPECNTRYNNILQLSCYETHYTTAEMIIAEKHDNKTLLKYIVYYRTIGLYNNSFIQKRYRKKLTFNLDSGMTYDIPLRELDKPYKNKGIKNITYGYSQYPFPYHHNEDMLDCLYKYIVEYKEKKCGHKLDYKNGELRYPNFLEVALINRFPNVPIKFIRNNLINKTSSKNFPLKAIKTDNWMQELLEFLEIENKKYIRKILLKNTNLDLLKTVCSIVKQPSNITKIMDYLNALYNYYNNNFNFKKFLPFYIDKLGETIAINKCLKIGKYEFYDVCEFFNRLSTYDNFNPDNYDYTISLKELHDVFSSDLGKISEQNRTIPYEEKIINNETLNNVSEIIEEECITLKAAKDTYELIDVGTQMNICVGRYGDRAVDKDCNIFVVRDSKEKPIVCIELSKDYKCIIQAKAKFNGRLPKNLYSFVKKWCKTNNINYDKCYDLKYYKNEGGDLIESID